MEAIIAGSTAGRRLRIALGALEPFAARYGVVRDTDGEVQRLVVFGMGKARRRRRLNFSSDIDLVYAFYPTAARWTQDYFARLGQTGQAAHDAAIAWTFSAAIRNAGRVALSFAAMELLLQREGPRLGATPGRARPVAGDLAAGERLLHAAAVRVPPLPGLRRLDGLRAMTTIAAEVAPGTWPTTSNAAPAASANPGSPAPSRCS